MRWGTLIPLVLGQVLLAAEFLLIQGTNGMERHKVIVTTGLGLVVLVACWALTTWASRPRRRRYRLPCWLVGHKWVWGGKMDEGLECLWCKRPKV